MSASEHILEAVSRYSVVFALSISLILVLAHP